MSRPIDLVLERLAPYRLRAAAGRDRWRACCPAHGGKNVSALSVGIGAEDQVLLRCWHGCEVEQVTHAIGLELSDLFPAKDSHAGKPRRIGLLTAGQCLDVIAFECTLVWTAAHNLANGHGLTAGDLERLSVAAARITGLVREARA
jgi:hypothetical protein